MTKKMTNEEFLALKPSALIRLAVEDLILCESNPEYIINMSEWLIRDGSNCTVCLAGAVMAQSLDEPVVSMSQMLLPLDYGPVIASRLFALNNFRSGYIWSGLEDMGITVKEAEDIPYEWLDVAEYSRDPEEFKKTMLEMAEMLEGHGL